MQKFTMIVAAVAACLMTMATAQNALADRECKNGHITRTGGTADNEFWARKKARDAWRQQTEKDFDKKWSAWYLTKDREYNCFMQDGKHRCTAKAIPCRSTIVVQGPRKLCDVYVIEGTGEAAGIQEWAKHNARKKWSERARMIVGDDFDTWLLANNRKVECKDVGDGKDVCKASATPCRYSIVN